ncbi:BMP-2-inducible protein kinase isoform X1 [Hydra vulgaris]|nr:BMP-2-inducible protein kinase [Hydra vulgaris]
MMKKLFQGNRTGWVGKQFQVGRYTCTVEDVEAEGGFALVFVVRTSNGQKFALKRLSVNEKADLKVCQQEIEIMKMLSGHKNAITFLDSAINVLQPGIYEVLILMEMCKGNVIDLMNENMNTGFSEKMILKMFCDTCEVLALLHDHDPPIIHRDIKVENILIKENGEFVLCDFGSATMGAMNTNKDSIRAIEDDIMKYTTVSYRSPEMIDLYSGHVIDTKSDIWALGCLLFKFCFFVPPFGESTLAIQSGNFSFPENSKYSKELHNLISSILIPDPVKRPNIHQVIKMAFKLAGCLNPPNLSKTVIKDTSVSTSLTEKKRKSSVPSQPKSLNTAVASRERPVATSLAPRQRPKGNSSVIEAEGSDGAMPYKHSHIENVKKSSNLRRSHSLRETTNQTSLLNNQSNSSSFENDMTPQNPVMNINSYHHVPKQDLLLQQRDLYLQQQFMQHQQIQYLQHQEYLRQQQQHYEYFQQQHDFQKQREMFLYQQELEMRAIQQQNILRQRQEEYARLQNLHDSEQQNNQNKLNEANISSSTPFSDDFSRTPSDSQNPFSQDIVYGVSIMDKKNTHNRSKSEIISKPVSEKDKVIKSESKVSNPFSDNMDVGVLLEIDDDEHFIRLQKEFLELGIGDNTAAGNNMHGLADEPNQLLLATKKYHYERTSSCSSSNSEVRSSSESSDGEETKYTNLNQLEDNIDADATSMNKCNKIGFLESRNNSSSGLTQQMKRNVQDKDVFDSAPFLISDTSKVNRNVRSKDNLDKVTSSNNLNTSQTVFSDSQGFTDQFTSKIRSNQSSDLFGMAPIDKIKTTKSNNDIFADNPFNMASSTKFKDEGSKNAETSRINQVADDNRKPPVKISDDPFGCAPFVKSKTNRMDSNVQTKISNRNRQIPGAYN